MNGRWKKVLRSLLVAECVVNLILGVAGSVPQGLQDTANGTYAKDPRPFHLFLAIACSLGLLKIVAQVALFMFKHWARPLFTILAIAGIVGPFVGTILPPELAGISNPPFAQSMADLLSMMDGATIALIYASPVGALFVRAMPQTDPRVDNG